MKRTSPLFLALLSLFVFSAARASDRIWIVPLAPDRTIEDAWGAGALLLDRFPEAVLVADEGSARALRRAGFAVEGPVRLPSSGALFLVRSKESEAVGAGLARALGDERPAVHLLWSAGRNAIVWSAGRLPETEGFVTGRALRERPLRRPIVSGRRAPAKTLATEFSPVIGQIVDRADSASYMQWIGNLAGSNEIVISGHPFTIETRYTSTAQCDTAERYVYERFLAMGYDDVEFDPFTFSGTSARNVIATLPGTETPERIYILGGHVDATSQNPTVSAPGANDNASGTASVLLAAEILKDYSFRSTIRFIAFTGEEQGLRGSTHYAADAAANGDSILGVVICDMVAWYQNEYKLIIEGEPAWDWLMQIMRDACAEYTGLSTRLDYYSWGSDHVPFQNEGFPAFLAIEKEYDLYPCYHKVCDTTEMNKADFGVDVTKACIAALAALAEPAVPTAVAGAESPPLRLVLHGNEPNPFNPQTRIRFELPAAGEAEIAVFDVSGRLVQTVLDKELNAGRHETVWKGKDGGGASAPSGVYFYRLTAGRESKTGKMLLIR
ncbi:MAG: M20/M25/M40 family metallo-hydrolase [Candidatus Eisenbacteria bacterium]